MAENSTLWTWGNQQKYHTEVKENIETKLTEHIDDTDIHLTMEDVASLVSNENLLINSDFRNAINQRGKSEYTGGGYTIDCWKCGGTIKLEVADGYIDVTQNTSGGNTITQYFEVPERFAGESITISVCCQLIEGDGKFTIATYDTATEGGSATDGTWTNNYITADDTIKVHTVKASTVNGLNHIAMRPSVAGSKVRLYWAKLEIGEHATRFIAPDPATELAKCQRYLYILRGAYFTTLSAFNDLEASSWLDFFMITPVTLRNNKPSISFNDICVSNILDGNIVYDDITTIEVRRHADSIIRIVVWLDENKFATNTQYTLTASPTADTEPYLMFSAEI